MRLTALIAAAALTGVAAPALAQTAAPAAASTGVTVADTRTWLTGLGGQVSEPTMVGNAQIVRIADQPLPWSLTFYACATLCDDVQYSATFTGPITEAQVTAWNRDNRYVTAAWYAPETEGGEASVLARYDVLLTANGAEQLREPTVVWLQQLRAFAQYLAGPAAPAAPPAGQ
ncbi:hypothetical protein GCM10009422_06000 [Brevundimonas kwangchunensis]|uniref:YbjN domain-containing protein n=1 Tax=Brevundimonas kwangchunensis TaxID=322163 RepID=A0ABN1GL93_9CAUL